MPEVSGDEASAPAAPLLQGHVTSLTVIGLFSVDSSVAVCILKGLSRELDWAFDDINTDIGLNKRRD
jgi:hypothetical protein